MKISRKVQEQWNEEFKRAANITRELPLYFDECITKFGPPVTLRELLFKDYIEQFSNPDICPAIFNSHKFCKACGISNKTVILDSRFEQYMGVWTIKGIDPYEKMAEAITASRVMVTNGSTMVHHLKS